MEGQTTTVSDWKYRAYTISATVSDFLCMQNQMAIQNEATHNVIILDIEFFTVGRKAKIKDKVRVNRAE